MNNSFLLVSSKGEYPAHGEVGYIKRDDSGEWEGKLGTATLSQIILDEKVLQFQSHKMGNVPQMCTLACIGSNLYRLARFESYCRHGRSTENPFDWLADRQNKTILLIPQELDWLQRFFSDPAEPSNSAEKEGQVYIAPW